MSNKFEKGDRVILTGKHLLPGPEWPVWGSEYECVGVVTDVDRYLAWIRWDNNITKVIQTTSLSHFTGGKAKSLSPNLAFLKYKREQNEKCKRRG